MDRSSLVGFDVDLDRLLMDENRLFNPLGKSREIDFRVVDARNGYAQLSVVLPVEMIRHFSDFLDSMAGLFRCSDRNARLKLSAKKPLDAEELERVKVYRQSFSDDVCTLFDDFIAQGLTRNKAISQTNLAMKAQKHPWATYDLVQQTLRDQGRFSLRKRKKAVK